MQDPNIVVRVKEVGGKETEASMKRLSAAIQSVQAAQGVQSRRNIGSLAVTGKLTNTLDQQAAATNNVTSATKRASKSQGSFFAHIAKTTVQSLLVNKAFLVLIESMGRAIKQTDLLENFPAIMGSVGISAEAASKGLEVLRGYVQSVGGDVNLAANSVKRFVGVNKNINASVAMYAGLNNALIAGGSSTERQAQAMEQLTQAYSRGRPDAIEFKTISETLALQLTEVAKALELPNTNALKEQLLSGKLSMNEFVTELTKLSTGTGPIAKQAMAQMQGIEFAGKVLQNTLVNGLTAIYQAVGRQNIVAFFSVLTQVISVLAGWAVVLINTFINLFNWISKLFGGPQISNIAGETAPIAENLNNAANSAADVGDGLDGAAKSAKKLNKQLAGFDKMNVLTESEATDSGGGGKDKKPAGTGGAFDPAQAAALEKIFANLGKGIQKAGLFAKILAGILTGLATNALISKLFGVNPLKSLLSSLGDAGKSALGLNKKLEKVGDSGEKAGKSWGTKFGAALRSGGGKTASAVSGFISGVAVGIGAALTSALSFVWGAILAGLGAIGTAVASLFIGAAAAATLPLWAVVAIGAAVVAAIVAILWVVWDNWEIIVEWLKGAWDSVLEYFSPAIGWFKNLFNGIKEGVLVIWDGLFGLLKSQFDKLKEAWNNLSGAWNDAVSQLRESWDTAVGKLREAWDELMKSIGDAWDKFYEKIEPGITKIQELFEEIKTLVTPVIDSIKEKFAELQEAVQPLIDKVQEFYDESIKPLVDGIKEWMKENDILKNALNVLGIILAVVILAPIVIIAAAIGLIVAGFILLAVAILWVVTKFIEFATYILGGGLWEDIKNAVASVTDFFKKKFREALDSVKAIWSTVTTWFKENVWDKIVGVFAGVGKWFKNIFQGAWNGIKNIFGGLWTWFKKNVWDRVKGVFSGVGQWFRNIFRDAWNGIKSIFGGLWSWFKKNVWDKVVNIFKNIGKSIGDGVGGAFKGVINTALKFVSGFINTVIRAINGAIKIINKIPKVEIGLISEVKLPRLATGGVVTSATPAIIGESGAEAVMPLEQNTGWIDQLASKINKNNNPDNSDIIPVTNRREQASNNITIHVSGVLATNEQDKRKLAEMIAKQLESNLRAKGMKGAF